MNFQTAAVEGQNAIKHNITVELSPQELVDCSGSYGNSGCSGGAMNFAFKYIKDHGIASEADYPYIAHNNKCHLTNKTSVKVTGFVDVPHKESILKKAVGTWIK